MYSLKVLIALGVLFGLTEGWFWSPRPSTPTSTSGITIVSRASWGARAPRRTRRLSTPVSYVFIHHTDTPTSSTGNAARVRSIQNYHMNTKGWDDIGYSFLIGTDGQAYEGRGWRTVGAHTRGYNSRGYGIALIGTFSTSLPSSTQLQAAKNLIKYGVSNGYISSSYSLYGHRDAGSTQCPGNRLYSNVRTWSRYGYRPLSG